MLTTRFAPSPTGYLHLGHAFAAWTAWRRARDAGGTFLLRIEDIDAQRCRQVYVDAIFDDLAWLGLDWDGTPRIQSAHLADYAEVLDELARRDLIYPCFCTRADIRAAASAPHGPDGAPVYPGTCRALPPDLRARRMAQGEPYAMRLDMAAALSETGALSYVEEGEGIAARLPSPLPLWEGSRAAPARGVVRNCDPARFGDVVLARKDLPASYHLCAVSDDARQGVTLVIRGADLREATDIHRVLQALMGWPVPTYAHHALLTDALGRRLAKREGAATLREMRAGGMTPGQAREAAGLIG